MVIAWLEDVANGRSGARRLLEVAVASSVATLLNPYGVGVWTYGLGLAVNPTIRRGRSCLTRCRSAFVRGRESSA